MDFKLLVITLERTPAEIEKKNLTKTQCLEFCPPLSPPPAWWWTVSLLGAARWTWLSCGSSSPSLGEGPATCKLATSILASPGPGDSVTVRLGTLSYHSQPERLQDWGGPSGQLA